MPKRDDLFDPNQLKNLKSLPLKSYEVITEGYKDLDDLFEYRYDTATDYFLRRAKSLIDEILCHNLKFECLSKTLDRSIMHKNSVEDLKTYQQILSEIFSREMFLFL